LEYRYKKIFERILRTEIGSQMDPI